MYLLPSKWNATHLIRRRDNYPLIVYKHGTIDDLTPCSSNHLNISKSTIVYCIVGIFNGNFSNQK